MDRVEILTAADMAETDRRTMAECGVPMSALMGNAGAAVARFLERRYPEAKRLLFLCGKGNNGGDGIVAAKVLAATGDREITVAISREDLRFERDACDGVEGASGGCTSRRGCEHEGWLATGVRGF